MDGTTHISTATDAGAADDDGPSIWGSWGLRLEICPARPWLSMQARVIPFVGMAIFGISKLAVVATWPVWLA